MPVAGDVVVVVAMRNEATGVPVVVTSVPPARRRVEVGTATVEDRATMEMLMSPGDTAKAPDVVADTEANAGFGTASADE